MTFLLRFPWQKKLGLAALTLLVSLQMGFAQVYTPPASGRSAVDLTTSAWTFIEGDPAGAQQPSFNDSAWSQVTLPHTWNVLDGQTSSYYRGVGWYRYHYTVPAAYLGQKIYLQFDGANLVTNAYVNGQLAGAHSGGHAGFIFDVTSLLNYGADNVIAVQVNNALNNEVAPTSGDFTMYGGLYRKVRLLVLPTTHVTPLDYDGPGVYLQTTNVSSTTANLQITSKIRNDAAAAVNVTVTSNVVDVNSNLVQTLSSTQSVAAGADFAIGQNADIANPHLWNGRIDPYLYTAYVEVRVDGTLVDLVSQQFGFRSFVFDKNRGFLLNGQVYDLHGTSMHEMRQGEGNAISDADRAQQIGLLTDIGATFVRLTHYQHGQATYQLADQTGLVVSTEVPFVNNGTDTDAFQTNLEKQLREMIRQNYNHPSICMWGLMNEIGSSTVNTAVLNDLNNVAHAEDSTRPTASASNASGSTSIDFVTDLQSFNRYYGWYGGSATGDLGKNLDGIHGSSSVTKPIGLSEYGAGANIAQHQDNAPAPAAGGQFHPEEYQNTFHEGSWFQTTSRPYIFCKTIWLIHDFASATRNEGNVPGLNDKGLVTADLQTRKDAFYYYKAQWTTTPFVYLTDRRFNPRTNSNITIRVYSNCDTVQVTQNGVSLGTFTGTADHIFTLPATLVQGNNQVSVVGTKGNSTCADAVQWFVPNPITITLDRPAGPRAFLAAPGSLQMNASATQGGNPVTGAVQFAWSQVSGPATVAFESPAAARTVAAFTAAGDYVVAVSATDGNNSTTLNEEVVVSADQTLAGGFVAYWKFDDGSGTTAVDASGAGRPATLAGNAGWTTTGKIDGAAAFNGTTSYQTFASPDTNQITVAAWVYSSATGNSLYPRIVDLPDYRLAFRRSSDGYSNSVSFSSLNSSATGDYLSASNVIGDGAWYHVAVTYDRTNKSNLPIFYVNGTVSPTTILTSAAGTSISNLGTGYIGNRKGADRAWNGSIDDLRIYSRLLTPGEVFRLASVPPPNLAPVVTLPAAGSALTGTSYSLGGTATDDGGPSPLAYSWGVASGPAQPTFDNAAALATAVSFSTPGFYRLKLFVDDGAITSAAETALTVLTPYQNWAAAYFNAAQLNDPSVSGPNADPNGDGIPNLVAYATGTSPLVAGSANLPATALVSGSLDMTFQRDTQATDINFNVQASMDLTGWTTIASGGNGASLAAATTGNGPAATVVETGTGRYRMESIIDAVVTPPAVSRFLRLQLFQGR